MKKIVLSGKGAKRYKIKAVHKKSGEVIEVEVLNSMTNMISGYLDGSMVVWMFPEDADVYMEVMD